MIAFNVIFIFLNLLIIIVSYFVMNRKFEKKYLNREIINNVKKELNSLMLSLNNTTRGSVDVMEAKTGKLRELLFEADQKIQLLEERLKNIEKRESKIEKVKPFDPMMEEEDSELYSPQKVFKKKNQKIEADEIAKFKKKIAEEELEQKLAEMDITQKILFLQERGFLEDEIRKKLALDAGEFEFLININHIDFKI